MKSTTFSLVLTPEFLCKGTHQGAIQISSVTDCSSCHSASIGPGPEVTLGKATIKTTCKQNDYTVMLHVDKNALSAERVYQLAAPLRVGATNCPALVNGFIEGGTIEMYNP